jgi:hypothetical protein
MTTRRTRSKRKAAPTTPAEAAPLGPVQDDDVEDVEGLAPRELRFADALAAGGNLHDGATAAAIGYRTAKRWHRRPEIAAAIRARVSASLAQARSVLASGSARAARSLVDMSDGRRKALAPKVSAARAVIETSTKLSELEDVVARLSELESRLSEKENAS